jgi:hypothetical protein
VVGRP